MSTLAISELAKRKESVVLIVSVFIAGLCSIIYELLIGTTTSYFLGDSVKQFSLTIGFYMAAMGVGSYISRFLNKNLLVKFIGFEILLGFLGGISVPALYLAFAYTDMFYSVKTVFIISIGILIGLEVPLLTRLLDQYYTLKVNISNILSLDYFGALIATLLFPFILLPFLGTFKSSLFFGLINMLIGFINLWAFSEEIQVSKKKSLFLLSVLTTLMLGFTLYSSNFLLKHWHDVAYEDRVVYSKQSPYQTIVLTKNKEDIRLFLNGSLQFSSIDEYRYHEALVHTPFATNREIKSVLLLGGGDGLAVREVLKYPNVKKIVLVDLDPQITNLGKKNPYLKKLNEKSLYNEKVTVLNQDAFVYLKESKDVFDLVISDLPDPNNVSLARLYSLEFYKFLEKKISKNGLFVTQATSPFYAKETFWCIDRTIKKTVVKHTYPFHVNVPSFAEWGFILGSKTPLDLKSLVIKTDQTKFLNQEGLKKSFIFEKDLLSSKDNYSSLESPAVLSYYLNEWQYWD